MPGIAGAGPVKHFVANDMKPQVTFITLGVDDLQRAVAFYRDGHLWEVVFNPAYQGLG